jgi:NDP-sugar pyrophosphorylase family protein
MQALILADGAAAALSSLTREQPAALLPVVNRPLIEHLLEHLVRHGVTEATVALHHCPYPVEAYLGDGARWGLALRYALARRPLGTAGTARRVAARWTGPFVLADATALTAVDLSKVLAVHKLRGSRLTLVVPATEDAGTARVHAEGAGLNGRPGSGPAAFAGLAIVEPEILGGVPVGEPFDLLADLVPRLLASGVAMHRYATTEPILVVRTLADLAAANRRALGGHFPGLIVPGFEVERGIRLSRGARVHREARLVAPVLVGPNALVARGATVEGTVVGEDVIVGARSTVRHVLLLPGTHVGRGLRLDDAVVDRDRIGHPATGTWTTVDDPRILGDSRVPVRPHPGSVGGRVAAAGLLLAGAPVWLPLLLGVAVESGGRPLRGRRVLGARGRAARLRRVAAAGPCGRLIRRLGLDRAPQLWSVVRGDLHWVGTSPRPLAETGLVSPAESPAARPGLVTLADLAPAPLGRADRRALDRLYAATRTRRGDLRLLAAALGRRLSPARRAARA